ncbi:MAG: hypothetical protein ABR562_04760, partial [Thermoplasmatota archaeon]
AAQLHASRLLGTTDAAYTQANTTLHELMSSYGSLALQLQDLLDKAESKATDAADGLPVLLEKRLASLTDQASRLRADAERLATAYARAAQTAAEQALATVQDAVKAHLASLQSSLDAKVAGLNSEATEVMSLVAARETAVRALVDATAANLTRMGRENGLDATAQVAAVQAAGDAAVKGLEAEGKSRVEALKAAAALLQSRAQAAVPRMSAMGIRALADVNGTLEDALARADATKAYLKDFATAQAEMAMVAERHAEALAEGALQDGLLRYTDGLKATALALTSSVPDVVASTSALVDEASATAQSEVGKDAGYIGKVAADYGKVPTDERKARAAFWTTVQGLDGTAVDHLDQAGQDLTALADDVAAAAAQAKADVEAVVAS